MNAGGSDKLRHRDAKRDAVDESNLCLVARRTNPPPGTKQPHRLSHHAEQLERPVKALVWHGKSDIRCEAVPDPKIEHGRDAIIR